MAGEPIAVAFVEVRPEFEDFKAEAESQLRGGLGEEGVAVRGNVELDGLTEARNEVSALTSDLQGITGKQLQFEGLDTAVRSTEQLTSGLTDAAQVDLSQNLRPAADAARALSGDVQTFAAELSGLPTAVNLGGFAQAEQDVGDLNSEVEALNENLGGAASTAGGIAEAASIVRPAMAGAAQAGSDLAEGFDTASTSGLATAKTVEDIALELKGLQRIGDAPGGPFRMLDLDPAAAKRISDAAQEVDVAMDGLVESRTRLQEADIDVVPENLVEETAKLDTAQTRLSSAIDRASYATQKAVGDETRLAGATRAATAATRTATVEEEKLIRVRARRSAAVGAFRLAGVGVGVGAALFTATRALGEASDALRVTGDEAGTTSGKLRNFGAAVLSGDVVGAFTALTNSTNTYTRAQLIAINQTPGLTDKLKEMGEGADLARSQMQALEGLVQVPQFLQTRIAGADLAGDSGAQLAALQDAQSELQRQEQVIRSLGLDQQALNLALEQVFTERKSIGDQIDRLTKEARPDLLAPLVEAITDARLTGDSALIIAALRDEKAELKRLIAAQSTNVEDRRQYKDDLLGVNREIESIQDEIVAEAQRHQQAMVDKVLQVGVIQDLEAEAFGTGGGTSGRSRRAQAIEATLARGTIDGKKLTSAQKESLLNELISINNEIESEQDAIIAEEERHAAEMQQKLDDEDQAFLGAIGSRQARGRNRQVIAEATATLNDDIAMSNTLQGIFREQIANARKTINDAKLRAETIAELTRQLDAEERNEKSLRQQRRTARIDRREESLDLDIQIAQANDNKKAEIRAHRAKIDFLQERIRHTRAGTNQRKRLVLELRQEQAAVRELLKAGKEEAKETGASFQQLAAAFLQERQGFMRDLGSNVQGMGVEASFAAPTAPDQAPRPPRPTAPTAPPTIPSPLPRGVQGPGGVSQAERAEALRASGGAPASQGQLEALIALTRETNRELRKLNRGVGHQEAKTSRALEKNKTVTGVE